MNKLIRYIINNKNKFLIIVFIGIIIILLTNITLFFKQSNDLSTDNKQEIIISSNTKLTTNSNIADKTIGNGDKTIFFSHGSEVKGPKIATIDLSPIDPKFGEKQLITTKVDHIEDITSVVFYIVTDNKRTKLNLELIKGDTKSGTWEISHYLNDTYNSKYQLEVDLNSINSNYFGTIILR